MDSEKWKTSFIGCVLRLVTGKLTLENMPSLPVNIFRKAAHCPASQTLLAYLKSPLTLAQRACVEAHLSGCEFCEAELQLLERYGQCAEEVFPVRIPAELRKLAEELLPNRAIRVGPIEEVSDYHRASN